MLALCGEVWFDVVLCGFVLYAGFVRPCVAYCCGVVWSLAVLMWSGVVLYGLLLSCVACCGFVWSGVVLNVFVWFCVVLCSLFPYRTEWGMHACQVKKGDWSKRQLIPMLGKCTTPTESKYLLTVISVLNS